MGADAVHALAEAAQAATVELFVNDRFMAKITAGTAVFGRDVGAQESELAGPAPNILADILLLSPLGLVRQHLGLEEACHCIAEDRQIVVHPR